MGTNRNASSYHYIGIAHRQAVELGMHRNLDNVRQAGLGERVKETMRATWFCLYILDRYVGVVEGRPFAIDDEGEFLWGFEISWVFCLWFFLGGREIVCVAQRPTTRSLF